MAFENPAYTLAAEPDIIYDDATDVLTENYDVDGPDEIPGNDPDDTLLEDADTTSDIVYTDDIVDDTDGLNDIVSAEDTVSDMIMRYLHPKSLMLHP